MDDQTRVRRAACTTFLGGDGLVPPATLLASIPSDVLTDTYGDGGVVAELERYVAELLGKPAAVFLPSGTMAQGATLRVHADRRARRTVLWHPHCHLDQHEGQGHARLHGLVGRPVGARHRLIELADLTAVAEPVAALLLELPQRDLGGQQPSWDELTAQVGWAREHGAAAHLDGARLWEAAAGYQRQPAEIAGLFDTVYVSFYKGIGALPGCCVAGSTEDVAEVREWRRRLGGTLHGLWPAAASALSLLPERLAEMPSRLPSPPRWVISRGSPCCQTLHRRRCCTCCFATRPTGSPRRPAGWPSRTASGSGRRRRRPATRRWSAAS
jgi:threonine aldolase